MKKNLFKKTKNPCLLLNTVALDPNRWKREKKPYFKLDQLLPEISGSGFNYVEIWQYHISLENEKYISSVYDLGNSLGLQYPVIGIYPVLQLTGRGKKNEFDRIKRIFNYAEMLNSKIIKIFVGNIGTADIEKKEYEISIEFLHKILETARNYGLIITGETHKKTLFDSAESTLKILKHLNEDNFKVCFQPYSFKDTEFAVKDYKELSGYVEHIHFQGRKDGKLDLLENSDIDYSVFLKEVGGRKFSGYFSIEFVKDCVVKNPEDFDLSKVLNKAKTDRDFIKNVCQNNSMEIVV